MLLFNENVFDGFVVGTGNLYTSASLNDVLGSADNLTVIGAVLAAKGGDFDVNFQLQVEHSFDGTRWMNLPGSSGLVISLELGDLVSGMDNLLPPWAMNRFGTAVAAAFVRIKFGFVGTSPSGHVRLFASGHTA